MSDRIDAELAVGRAAAVIGELEALTAQDPLDERVCAQLMTALYRSGRQAHALRAYQALRRLLAEEVGIEPGAELRRLEEAVLRQDLAEVTVPPQTNRSTARVAAPVTHDGASIGGVFVGREPELAALEASLGRALAGRSEVVIVSGEPGVGKTRLVEELAGLAVGAGARVAWGRCLQGDGTTSYWPWVQVLRQYLTLASEEELAVTLHPYRAELGAVLPELGPTTGTPAPPGNPDAARFRLFDQMVAALVEASAHAPSVIVLDDLQWADRSSLRLLEFMAQNLRNVRALLIVVHRQDEATQRGPLAPTLGTLARLPVSRVRVTGLGTGDVARYVELATGVVTPAVAEDVHRRTAGNAFFVRELVAFLAADGQLAEGAPCGITTPAIPDGVRDIVRQRCLAVTDEARRVLTTASVVGSEVRMDVIERACRGTDFVESVEELLAEGLLCEVGGRAGVLRFSHDLVREAIYGDLSAVRRARLHGDVADVLESLLASRRPPPLTEVARHVVAALPAGADPGRAVELDVLCAEAATRTLGYEDAVAHYARAVENLGRADQTRRCALLLDLGDAQWRAGDAASARETCFGAAEIGRELRDPRLVARAVLGCGGGVFRSWHTSVGEVNERLVSLLSEALGGLGEADDALRARLLGYLAEQLYYEPAAEWRLALSAEAVEVAERLDDPATLAAALCSRCLAAWNPDHLDERIALSSRILELGQALGDPELWMFGQHYLALASFEAGDVSTAGEALDAYEMRAEQLRQPFFRWKSRVLRAMQALMAGRFEDAERLAGEALAIGEQAGDPDLVTIYAVQLGMARMEQDRLSEVRPQITTFAEQSPETPWWGAALAFISADAGDVDDARRRFEALAADDFAALPQDFAWSGGMALLSLVASSLGDERNAAVLHRLLEPYADMTAMVGGRSSWGSVALYLGVLATTTGDYPGAEVWFEKALTDNARMGAATFVAHTRYHHARLLLLAGDPDAHARAGRLLDDAGADARHLGMARLERLVRDARRSA